MTDVFISYGRSTAPQAQAIAEALRALGYGVWRDDEIPAHRAYAEVIEERLKAAKAVIVVWSAEAVKSEWVQSEADKARNERKLVQLTLDGAPLPMPFDRIQCADMTGWSGDLDAPEWRKVAASVADLAGEPGASELSRASEPRAAQEAVAADKPSIAVLPFADMTGGGEDYFVDGMMEEIAGALTRFRSIFVIASAATLSFKGKPVTPQQVGRELGVRYLLEGSVRKAGGRVRIFAKLLDAADGGQVWGDRFEESLEDVFALQDKVALGVAGVIEPAILEAEIRRVTRRTTASPSAYDLYLRAMGILRTYVWADMHEAIALAERAIALDPHFGPALSLASRCHYLVVLYGWSEDPEHHRRQALAFARRAMRAAPEDAYVVGLTAMLLAYLEGDLTAALRLAERACALNPGAASAWYCSGAVRVFADQLDLAAEHLETSLRLNPVGPDRAGAMLFLCMARFQQRRFAEAAALARELFQHFENPTACAILAAAEGHMGRPDASREALALYARLSPRSIEALAEAIWFAEGHRRLFLDGVALGEGTVPSAIPAEP